MKDGQVKRFEREKGDDEVIVMLDTNELEIRAEDPASANYGDRENVYAVDETLAGTGYQGDIVVCGTDDADAVTSNSEYVTFYGGDGDDNFTGNASRAYGGDGDDSLTVSTGYFSDRSMRVEGGSGDDTITFSSPIRPRSWTTAVLRGDSGDDHIINESSIHVAAYGGTGTDTFTGRAYHALDFEIREASR